MGTWGDIWDYVKEPGHILDPFELTPIGKGTLMDREGGQTSDIPAADRNNFNLPGADARGSFLTSQAQGAQGRTAPQAADSSFRGYQEGLANRLQRQMNGEDSLAQHQLRQATDQNIAQQRSMAASAGPGNAAMAQRLAMQNVGQMNQGFGSQAAMLGIQERNAAANALGGVAQGARGQDLANNQFNANAQLQQRGMNDQYTQGMSGLELANAQGVQRGGMGYEQNQTQRRGQDLGQPVQPANWERMVGAAGALAPMLLAKGGLVTQPTNAIIGEAGPEVVVPLDKLPTLIDRLGERLGSNAVAARTKTTSTAPRPRVPTAEELRSRQLVTHERDEQAEWPWVQRAYLENERRKLDEERRLLDEMERAPNMRHVRGR